MKEIEIEIERSLNKSLFNICPYCLGTGKLKAMQSAMTYDAGTVRVNDTKVKCIYCNGTGHKEA